MPAAITRLSTTSVDEAPLTEGGSRQITPGRLAEAIGALRTAQQRYSRDRAPLEWAMLQNNLGNALTALGARARYRTPRRGGRRLSRRARSLHTLARAARMGDDAKQSRRGAAQSRYPRGHPRAPR